jgi:hypothetical protein
MDWKKTVSVIIFWAVIFAALLTTVYYENKPATLNAFSQNCPADQFQINGNCQASASCVTDADCSYLLIESLPTRVGKCEAGTCVAYCGSGISRPCR